MKAPGFFTENGVLSFARVIGVALVIHWMVFSGVVMVRTGTMVDIPIGELSLILLAYGITKTTEILRIIKKDQPVQQIGYNRNRDKEYDV